jgi:hypothetical protein
MGKRSIKTRFADIKFLSCALLALPSRTSFSHFLLALPSRTSFSQDGIGTTIFSHFQTEKGKEREGEKLVGGSDCAHPDEQ